MDKSEHVAEHTAQESGEMTVYEISYILLPTIATDEVSVRADELVSFIRSLGGEIISSEYPVLIDLAYEMVKVVQTVRHKVDSGFFGWVKFTLNPEQVGKIKKFCDDNPAVVRHLIIKTVRENTFIAGKVTFRKETGAPAGTADEPQDELAPTDAVQMEQIDKSIDDLVIA